MFDEAISSQQLQDLLRSDKFCTLTVSPSLFLAMLQICSNAYRSPFLDGDTRAIAFKVGHELQRYFVFPSSQLDYFCESYWAKLPLTPVYDLQPSAN